MPKIISTGIIHQSEDINSYMPSVVELDSGHYLASVDTGNHLAGVCNNIEILLSGIPIATRGVMIEVPK